MPQVSEIKISQKHVTLHNRRSQQGFALLWIIAILMAFSVLGGAIVATYNVSLFGQVETGVSLAAESMAESGYRFLFSEYQDQDNDVDKNILLDEIRFVDDATGKIFNVSPAGGGQFQLEMTSYFYRVRTDPGGGPSLALKFIGNAGFSVPDSGFLKVGQDETFYGYISPPATAPDTDGATIYTFSVTPNVPATEVYTSVRPVVQTTLGSDVNDGGTLTLASGQGSLFPTENGMFLITKQKIKANLPVETIVSYRYQNRDGDQLVNVQNGPHQSSFTTIDSGSTKIEATKFLSVDSVGFAPDKASALASETNTFRLFFDISAYTPGLKSYWSFDDAGDAGKDDYGTSDGTLEGGVSAGAGIVGGGLVFDATKTGYVSTTFSPSTEIGNSREFTIVFWANPTDVMSEQGVLGVSKTGQNFFIGIKNGHWEWGLGDQIVSDPGDGSTGLPKANAGEFQHVAFNYYFDSSGKDFVNFYINGIDTGYDEEVTGVIAIPTYNIYLGALYDPDTDSNILGFTGTLDELAIFNTSLNFCEVNAIFNVADVAATLPCNVGCDAIAYYPFNGNAGDESGTNRAPVPGYDGTVNGATLAEDQCGFADKAYSFDGSDYIATTFNSNTAIGTGNSFTVAFWAKPDRTDAFMSVVGAFNDPVPVDPSLRERFYIAIYDGTGGEWLWGYGDTPGPLDGSLPDAVADEWVHIGWVYDQGANEVIIYVNGDEIIQSDPYTGNRVLPNTNTDIGARLFTGTSHPLNFEGTIDEVLIWNEAKSATYMLDLYNGTKP